MRRPQPPSLQAPPTRQSSDSSGYSLWSDLIRPAIIIALVGGAAVLYLLACARLSSMQCDLRRLERLVEDRRAQEMELRRRLAEIRKAEEIRSHITRRHLEKPRGYEHVRLADLSPTLYEALPSPERDRREVRLGMIPPETQAPVYAPLQRGD